MENVSIYEYITTHTSHPLKGLFQISLTISQLMCFTLQPFMPVLCISDKLTNIHIKMLHSLSATYPVILVIITCILMKLHAKNCRIVHILWKPFSIILKTTNTTAVTGDAVIQAFASFILLSNGKVFLLIVIFNYDMLVRRIDGSIYKHVLVSDPNIELFGQTYFILMTILSLPCLFLTLIPSIVLIIYPTRIYSRYLSKCLSARKILAITTFAEALHSCFKDGLNGTRDYRSLAGLPPLILVMVLCCRYSYYPSDVSYSLFALVMCFLVSFIQPCKTSVANFSLGFLFVVVGVVYITQYLWLNTLTHTNPLVLGYIISFLLPHVLMLGWASYKLAHFMKRKLVHIGQRFNPYHYSFVNGSGRAGGYQTL